MAPLTSPDHPRVTRWLRTVALITFGLIVLGGFVRLTRSGLSIVEWNPVIGTLPPLSDAAWTSEFAKYQQSPEFKIVNYSMTLDGYQRIYLIEWAHRLIARVAGLAVVIPLAFLWWKGLLSRRRAGTFLILGLLFGLQGAIGWLMVASGLFDRPEVSHYRLTVHFMTALLLLGFTVWSMMDGDAAVPRRRRVIFATPSSRLSAAVLIVVLVQMAYGGLVAGLKAGHVSYSWPLMGGALVPEGLFAGGLNWATLTESAPVVHWIHRWFAFVAALAIVALVIGLARSGASGASRQAAMMALILVGVQIVIGVTMLLWHQPLALALLHQAVGITVFVALVVTNHRVLRD
jgi:cytochrome c oxidase assembly protein subunit 15